MARFLPLLTLTLGLAVSACDNYDACADKNCGDTCSICDPDDSSCVETAEVKVCNRNKVCTTAQPAVCQ